MIGARLIFYALYVVLGLAIVVRLLAAGLHWQTASGIILGAALASLGIYRLLLYARLRRAQR